MGIREKINENPMITGGVTAGVTLLAVIWCIWYAWTSCFPSREPAFTQAWYTTEQDKPTFTKADEGKLFFADKATKLAPFDRNGKEAVRVYLYTCDDGKTLIVGFLERYTPEARAVLEKAASRKGPPQPGDPDPMDLQMNGREIKKPGKEWVNRLKNEMAFQEAEQTSCPTGGELKPYFPPK